MHGGKSPNNLEIVVFHQHYR
ncbi:hypothetical protein NO1_2270, partial [Candidatus Termititenax aidoneus]